MQATHIATDWDLAAVRDPRLRQIHAYWDLQRGQRKMPTRADIDPVGLKAVLAHVFLIDVLGPPRDYRFRLAGTYLRLFAGMEVTGRRLDEVFPAPFAEELREHWDSTVAEAAPKVCKGRVWAEDRDDEQPWEGIILPLASPDGAVVMLLGGFAMGK